MGKGEKINTLRYRKNKMGLVGQGATVPSLSSASLRGLVLTERCRIQALNRVRYTLYPLKVSRRPSEAAL